MLNEIFNILENVVIAVMPTVLILYILYFIFTINKKKSHLKTMLSLICIIVLSFSILTNMMFQTLQVHLMLDTVEAETTFPPWFRTFSFLMTEAFYTIIFILGMFVITYFETHQIIPGHGSIKKRLKHQWETCKEELNESRRKRTTRRNKKEK